VTNTRSLTEDEIVELEAALTTRGTPAPWRVDQDVEGEARDVVGTLPDGETSVVVAECFDEFEADIIVRCRNTLPALLAEVRRLRASPPLAAEPRPGFDVDRAVAKWLVYVDGIDGEHLRLALLEAYDAGRPAPPLAAEGTAGPDLARIGLLIDAFEAAVDAFWQPEADGSDRGVVAAREALDAAIRALAATARCGCGAVATCHLCPDCARGLLSTSLGGEGDGGSSAGPTGNGDAPGLAVSMPPGRTPGTPTVEGFSPPRAPAPSPAPREATPKEIDAALDRVKPADLECGCTHASRDAAVLCAVRKYLRRTLAASPAPREATRDALEKCMAVLRWHLSAFQRKDEPMMLVALEAGEAALGRREKLVPPAAPPAPAQRDATCAGCGHAPHGEGECAGTVTEISQCGCLAAAPSPSGNPGKEPRHDP
jgi:hypothetical protein